MLNPQPAGPTGAAFPSNESIAKTAQKGETVALGAEAFGDHLFGTCRKGATHSVSSLLAQLLTFGELHLPGTLFFCAHSAVGDEGGRMWLEVEGGN